MKDNKGITIIVLIITVVIMLLLVGVSLYSINTGLIGKTQNTAELYNNVVDNSMPIREELRHDIDSALGLNSSETEEPSGPTVVTWGEEEYTYTGAVQTFIAPATTTYQLQVWGAQGGKVGGNGGYSCRNSEFNEGNNVIYICRRIWWSSGFNHH